MSHPSYGPPLQGSPADQRATVQTRSPSPPPYDVVTPTPPRPAAVWPAIAASAAVILVVVAHFYELWRLSDQTALVRSIDNGGDVTLADATAGDQAVTTSVAVFLGTSVIALILVMLWAHGARANAAAYTTSEFRRSRGWAIGGWICPVVNLWFPYQVVKDIWTASDTHRPHGTPIKAWAATAVLPLWWTCLIGADVVQRISVGIYGQVDFAAGNAAGLLRASLIFDFMSAAINIAGAIMFIMIVASVTRFQTERYEAYEAGSWPQ